MRTATKKKTNKKTVATIGTDTATAGNCERTRPNDSNFERVKLAFSKKMLQNGREFAGAIDDKQEAAEFFVHYMADIKYIGTPNFRRLLKYFNIINKDNTINYKALEIVYKVFGYIEKTMGEGKPAFCVGPLIVDFTAIREGIRAFVR